MNNQRVIIWRAEIIADNEIYLAVPGQISSMDKTNGSIVVICGIGKLKLTEIEIDSQRGYPAKMITSIRQRLI